MSLDGRSNNIISDDLFKGEKKTKRRSMLAWFKLKKTENGDSVASLESDHSSNASPATSGSVSQIDPGIDVKGRRKSVSRRVDEVAPVDPFFEPTQAGELFSAAVRGRRPPPTGTTMADQMDLLREQVKMLGGEAALCTSTLKRLTEHGAANPDDTQIQAQMRNLKDEILEKKRQMRVLERRIVGNGEVASNNAAALELSQTISKLTNQLNEKSFELEIKSADNRILQEQLQAKANENTELQQTITVLQQQIGERMENIAQSDMTDALSESGGKSNDASQANEDSSLNNIGSGLCGDLAGRDIEAFVRGSLSSNVKTPEETAILQSQILDQVMEIEKLRQEKDHLMEEKDALQIQGRKLAEESSYAKELASAAAVELKNLAEEVTKLSYQNSRLAAELATAQELAYARAGPKSSGRQRMSLNNVRRMEEEAIAEELRRGLLASKEREAALEADLAEKELRDAETRKKLEDAKRREANLENDVAGMWVLVAKLRKARGNNLDSEGLSGISEGPIDMEEDIRFGNGYERLLDMDSSALRNSLEKEREHNAELEMLVSQLKSEDLSGLDIAALEDLSALHVEALTKLCHTKANMQHKVEKDKPNGSLASMGVQVEEDKSGHVCKVCFEAPTAAVLLPCRHFSLCKSCAVACTECPLCRTVIQDRIITFT